MKLLISGGWSYGNIGDEVIAESTIKLFSRAFNEKEILYTSYCPQDFKEQHKTTAVDSVHKIIEKKVKSISDFKEIVNNTEKYGLEEYSKLIDEKTIFISVIN